MIVCDERTQMDDVVFVYADVVKVGDAGDVDQGFDALPHTALELED